jgi:hypothetical protein
LDGGKKGAGGAALGEEFPPVAHPPIARKLSIRTGLATCQVMRRTPGTDMQQHGTLKDTQGMLRHASIKTTGDVYVQTIEQSVLAAVNSHTSTVLGDRKMPEKSFGLKGRNLKGPNAIWRRLAKPDGEEAASA